MIATKQEIEHLILRCQQGELAAFTDLFRLHESQVYRLAITILHNEQDAEDVVQDVFLRIFQQINRYEGKSTFKTWLTTIVVNTCRDRLRRKKVRKAFSLDWILGHASDQDVDREVSDRQDSQQLWSRINQLDDKLRIPLILHYHERIRCDEIAEILGVKTSTIYARLNNARKQLRATYQESLPDVESQLR